jgi:hypothetical protein
MTALDVELLEKFVSPKDIITVIIVWMLVKNKAREHFRSIETSLESIGKSLIELKDSLIKLEIKQTQKINNLSDRVTKIENKLPGGNINGKSL